MQYDDIVYVVCERTNPDKLQVPVAVGESYFLAVEASDDFRKEQFNNNAYDFNYRTVIESIPFYRAPKMDFWTTIAYILMVFPPWRLVRKLGVWIMLRHTRNLSRGARN